MQGGTEPMPADAPAYPVRLHLVWNTEERDRLSVAFRVFLAIPHLIMVGGPLAFGLYWGFGATGGFRLGSGGAIGAAAGASAVISWFAILFTGRHPPGLRELAEYYLRWRVRAVAYASLLRDEFPPLGDGPYAVTLELIPPVGERDPVTVAFRIILAIPHLVIVFLLGIAWWLVTVVAWFAILFTHSYPAELYRFSLGVFRWSTRVEAYMLLLTDDYPPFSLD
jgi:plasmid stabilization system protein ParE